MIACWILIAYLFLSGVSSGPLSPREDYQQAVDLFQVGKYQEAEVKLRDALLDQPDFAEAHYLLGRVFAATGRSGEAEVRLQKAAQLRPDFVQPRQLLGMLYCERKKYAAARDVLTKALELDPENSLSYFYLGAALEGLNDDSGAVSAYQRAFQSSDGHSEVHSKAQTSLGLLHLKLATAHSENGRLTESIQELEQAKELLPPSPEFLNLLGAAYLRANDSRAVPVLCQAAELNPTDQAWEKLAKTLARYQKFDEAVDLFESKVRQDLRSESFRILLGAAYWDKAEYFKALNQYEHARAINPNSAKAHYLIGSAHLEMGNAAAGQPFLEESLRLDPELVPANLAMANTLMERGRNQEALKFLERASLKKPDDAAIQLKLGQLCLDLKRYDESLKALRAAELLSPKEKKVHYLLGRLYTATGQNELARKEFAVFKSLEAARKKDEPVK